MRRRYLIVSEEEMHKASDHRIVFLRRASCAGQRAYDSVSEARTSIGRYLNFYNDRWPHSSLDRRTPDQAYFNLPPFRLAA